MFQPLVEGHTMETVEHLPPLIIPETMRIIWTAHG